MKSTAQSVPAFPAASPDFRPPHPGPKNFTPIF
jgi:hypothetical protein